MDELEKNKQNIIFERIYVNQTIFIFKYHNVDRY